MTSSATEHRYADEIREKLRTSGDEPLRQVASMLTTEQIIFLRDAFKAAAIGYPS